MFVRVLNAPMLASPNGNYLLKVNDRNPRTTCDARWWCIKTKTTEFNIDTWFHFQTGLKGTVMQIDKALINDRLLVSKVS